MVSMLLSWIHKNRNTEKLQIIQNQLKGFLIRTKTSLMGLARLGDLGAKIIICSSIRVRNQLRLTIQMSNNHEPAMA